MRAPGSLSGFPAHPPTILQELTYRPWVPPDSLPSEGQVVSLQAETPARRREVESHPENCSRRRHAGQWSEARLQNSHQRRVLRFAGRNAKHTDPSNQLAICLISGGLQRSENRETAAMNLRRVLVQNLLDCNLRQPPIFENSTVFAGGDADTASPDIQSIAGARRALRNACLSKKTLQGFSGRQELSGVRFRV